MSKSRSAVGGRSAGPGFYCSELVELTAASSAGGGGENATQGFLSSPSPVICQQAALIRKQAVISFTDYGAIVNFKSLLWCNRRNPCYNV